MVEHRRAMAIAFSVVALGCAVLGLVHVFGWADVPGGSFFVIATWPLLAATWVFSDVSRRWRTPKVEPTEQR